MLKSIAVVLLSATLFALGASSALAARVVSPADGDPFRTPTPSLPTLVTGLFGLGADLSTFGVSDSQLATVGPQASTTASPTSDHMLIVDDDHADCPNAQFTTIQSAVDVAPDGAMIKVCRGLYVEQVVFRPDQTGLTLYSVGDLQAVIKAPPVMDPLNKSIVLVHGAHDITIRHFTITGPGGGGCDSIEYGVRVEDGGSATITDNHITQIRDEPFSGCQNGVAVRIGQNAVATYGSGTVVHNLIDNYQKGGVVVDGQIPPNTGPPSHAEVAYNEIDGIGPTVLNAQNGIQISRGAYANVHHNVVKDNVYVPVEFTAEGILIFQVSSSQISVHHNDVFHNGDGIALINVQNIEVGWNRSHDQVFYDGLFADSDSTNNTIEYNKLTNNPEFDCDDISVGPYNAPAMVANPWIQDLGYTENRAGLCKHATP